jgi:hypothetical protein
MRERVPVLAAVLAFLHLAFVVASVWMNFGRLPAGIVKKAALTYCNVSGTFRDYSFFAPGVASALKAAFLVEEGTGGSPTLVTFGAESREIAFRYGSVMRSGMQDERGRDLFAQSWAALILGNRPSAESVTVMVERMLVPSMDEYRRGQRPEWTAVYAGRFSRRQAGGDASP